MAHPQTLSDKVAPVNGMGVVLNSSGVIPSEAIKRPFCFLELPPELRNRIYEFAVCEKPHTEIITYEDTGAGAQPPLSLTCRQLRSECLLVFYQGSTFRFLTTGHSAMASELQFGLLDEHISKLGRIEIANVCHSDYFSLDMRAKDPKTWCLETGQADGHEKCRCGGEKCFANQTSLAAGRRFLERLASRINRVRRFDAPELEVLIETLELPTKAEEGKCSLHKHNLWCRCRRYRKSYVEDEDDDDDDDEDDVNEEHDNEDDDNKNDDNKNDDNKNDDNKNDDNKNDDKKNDDNGNDDGNVDDENDDDENDGQD